MAQVSKEVISSRGNEARRGSENGCFECNEKTKKHQRIQTGKYPKGKIGNYPRGYTSGTIRRKSATMAVCGCSEEDRKQALAEAANNQMFMKDATAIVAAVGDPDISAKWYEKDTMIALEHMVLAATALGYGTCWIGAFDEDAVSSMLKIPERAKVVALLPIGIPGEKPGPK